MRDQNAQDKHPELGDVFSMHRESYCKSNTPTPEQYKITNAISNCRTSILGGHVDQCDNCGDIHIS